MKMGTIRSPWRYDKPCGPAQSYPSLLATSRRHCAKSLSGCRSFSRTPRWRFLGRWNEKVGRHSESGAQSLHHRHAQPLLAPQDFADPARGTEDRHHVGTREAVLIHQVTDQVCDAGQPMRPFALLIGSDQARLRLQPRNIGWFIRIPEPINECAGASKLRIAVD